MSALGKVPVWGCAILAAMPLAPCAFLMDACHSSQPKAASVAAAVGADSCCATHGEPEHPANRPHREAPCRGDCCRAAPLVPAADKPASSGPALSLAAATEPADESMLARFVPVVGAAWRPSALHILHCRWRC